ncbi:MAG: hypothetical protein JWP74_3673 [Marmoricola sp.]|nr:hypothetical protein [Marmoricola sp.]
MPDSVWPAGTAAVIPWGRLLVALAQFDAALIVLGLLVLVLRAVDAADQRHRARSSLDAPSEQAPASLLRRTRGPR